MGAFAKKMKEQEDHDSDGYKLRETDDRLKKEQKPKTASQKKEKISKTPPSNMLGVTIFIPKILGC